MKNRKSLIYVFATIILIIGLMFSYFLFNRTTIKIISYKNCHIQYFQYSKGYKELYTGHQLSNEMEYELALRKLGFCLSQYYDATKDTSVTQKILELYIRKYNYFPSYTKQSKQPIDSIIKYSNVVFDTVILFD